MRSLFLVHLKYELFDYFISRVQHMLPSSVGHELIIIYSLRSEFLQWTQNHYKISQYTIVVQSTMNKEMWRPNPRGVYNNVHKNKK